MSETAYDRIGRGYANSRQTEPRIAARIEVALKCGYGHPLCPSLGRSRTWDVRDASRRSLVLTYDPDWVQPL